jgi:signal transduction histidine kinase
VPSGNAEALMPISPTGLTVDERAALQLVAVLVGRGSGPEELAAGTLEEIGRLVGADVMALATFAELVATGIANARAREELRGFADEQAALRRVATLVARAASPEQVFAAVAAEVGRLLQVGYTVLSRYDPDGFATVVGGWARTDPGRPLAIGLQVRPEGRNIHSLVFETRRPARIDNYGDATGDLGDLARDWGYRSAVGVPIIVEGRMWGVMIAGSLSEPLASNTENRLSGFTGLVATAIANAQIQTALTVSRSRIVAADDTARRRLERNLHDGVQQHLIALSLQLREAQASVPPEATKLESQLDEVVDGLAHVLDELREIAHGIHPAGLSEGGLEQALATLTERSAVPVRLDIDCTVGVPEPIEVAAYYVVAESLANASKYADASQIDVRVRAAGAELRVIVRDDGRGGADLDGGSGLVGLRDRVEALGGWLWLRSPPGGGTEVGISLPLTTPGEEDASAENA